MGILWIGFQWLQTIKSTVRGLENTEKRLEKYHLQVESSETRLSPSWRIKHTCYVHGYFKQNVCYVVFKPFINLCLQLPRLRFKDWETIKTSSLIRYYGLLRYSQDSERQNYLDVPLNETSLCLLC